MIEKLPIGIPLGDKLKLLREAENLSQKSFSEIVGISRSTLANVESGQAKTVGVDLLSKICNHPRFTKYSIWLMVDELTDAQVDEMLSFLEQLKTAERDQKNLK